MKKKSVFAFIFVIIFSFSFFFYFLPLFEKNRNSSSAYNIIKEYSLNNKFPENFNLSSFDEDTAEFYFFKGLKYYSEKDIDKAEIYFKKAQKYNKAEPALFVYINFYLNSCIAEKTGKGDPKLIKAALDTMGKYSFLSNDTETIWQLALTMLGDNSSRGEIISILEKYLENAVSLKIENKLIIKGNIAMIRMANREYGESIYAYYEILSESEKIKDLDTRYRIQVKSHEYLGNMYFILEDYNAAIAQYNKAISIPIEDLSENAKAKYGSYVNRSESYIQIKDYTKARESSLETKKIIPYLSSDLAVGVKVFRYKNLLLLESYRKNFKRAEIYYNFCQELLKMDKGHAFINAEMYVELAYCEMLIQQKKIYEAIDKLNLLLKKDLEEGWGFDSSIYTTLLKLYKETGQSEKFFATGEKLHFSNKDFNDSLKKDYLNFVKNSYTLEQLKKEKRIFHIEITLLWLFGLSATVLIIFAVKHIFRLNKDNSTDALTNIYNRKYLKVLEKQKLKKPVLLTFIMIDIDYFKKYNDFYGHPAGDSIIRKTAEVLKESIRKEDTLLRYGGEEFLILLENADIKGFETIYSKIIENLNKQDIKHEKSLVSDKLTLSMGVSFNYFTDKLNLKKGIEEADKALYLSKENGRNRYTIYKK